MERTTGGKRSRTDHTGRSLTIVRNLGTPRERDGCAKAGPDLAKYKMGRLELPKLDEAARSKL